MYLKTLELKNFRCFERIQLDLHENLTVVVGANGSGKTSLIEGAAIALGSIFVKMDGLTARKIEKEHAHLKAYAVGSTKDVQAQYPVSVFAAAKMGANEVSWKRSLNSSNGQTLYGEAKEITALGMEYQNQIRKGDLACILPMFAYYGTGRLWDYHREKQSDVFETNNRLNGYIDCLDGTANIKLMMNWFVKMTVLKYQNQEIGLNGIPELEAVYSAMEMCYKRITGCEDVKMQYNIGNKELEVVYREKNGDIMRIPINQLSDGYKSTISLVADIAYRMAVLNPQLLEKTCQETPGIVLIDEIDLHLHPTWQQRILGDLRAIFPKIQFIVSTHAPAVISSVKSENLVLLEQGDIYEPAGEVHGKDTNTIVRSVMKASERPIEIKKMFQQFYEQIDNKKAEDAADILRILEETIGDGDAELAACRIKLKLLKVRRS